MRVSVLFNEPKLLKSVPRSITRALSTACFSALQRAEIAEMFLNQNNPARRFDVSVLFNEPKLLKSDGADVWKRAARCFSALQRAEIAEIKSGRCAG